MPKSRVIIQPKGDVDTVNVLTSPELYGLDLRKAFSILEKDGKKIGLSVLCCLDNKEILDEVRNSLKDLL